MGVSRQRLKATLRVCSPPLLEQNAERSARRRLCVQAVLEGPPAKSQATRHGPASARSTHRGCTCAMPPALSSTRSNTCSQKLASGHLFARAIRSGHERGTQFSHTLGSLLPERTAAGGVAGWGSRFQNPVPHRLSPRTRNGRNPGAHAHDKQLQQDLVRRRRRQRRRRCGSRAGGRPRLPLRLRPLPAAGDSWSTAIQLHWLWAVDGGGRRPVQQKEHERAGRDSAPQRAGAVQPGEVAVDALPRAQASKRGHDRSSQPPGDGQAPKERGGHGLSCTERANQVGGLNEFLATTGTDRKSAGLRRAAAHCCARARPLLSAPPVRPSPTPELVDDASIYQCVQRKHTSHESNTGRGGEGQRISRKKTQGGATQGGRADRRALHARAAGACAGRGFGDPDASQLLAGPCTPRGGVEAVAQTLGRGFGRPCRGDHRRGCCAAAV